MLNHRTSSISWLRSRSLLLILAVAVITSTRMCCGDSIALPTMKTGTTATANSDVTVHNKIHEQQHQSKMRELQGSSTPRCEVGNFIRSFTDDTAESFTAQASGAVGRDRLVSVINSRIEVRNKVGDTFGRITHQETLQNFFKSLDTMQSGSFIANAKVVYDEHTGRFLVVANHFAGTTLDRILVAVSKNELPDSTSAWHMIAINSLLVIGGTNSISLYISFEVDKNYVFITASMYKSVGREFQGIRLWIIDKGMNNGFYDGDPPTIAGPYNPFESGGRVSTPTIPTQIHGIANDILGNNIGTFLVSYYFLADGNAAVEVTTVLNPLRSDISFVHTQIVLGMISQNTIPIPDAPQLGTANLVSTGFPRPHDAVWRNNKLWLTITINPRAPDINANQATAHWVRLDTSSRTGSITLDAQGNLGGETFAPQTSTYIPAVALNSLGEAGFGYSASSPSTFVGAHGSVVVGTTEWPFTVKSGLDYYNRPGGSIDNWGDYSGISVDAFDDSFWIFNQFAAVKFSDSENDGRWGTAWARVSGNCPSTKTPTKVPTRKPSKAPTRKPSKEPTRKPSKAPTRKPSKAPTRMPTKLPTRMPTKVPTSKPTKAPTNKPTNAPTNKPTKAPTNKPTVTPTNTPTKKPTQSPTQDPTKTPTKTPTTQSPTRVPTREATKSPTNAVTSVPTRAPTNAPVSIPVVTTTSPVRRICRFLFFQIPCCGFFARLLGYCRP